MWCCNVNLSSRWSTWISTLSICCKRGLPMCAHEMRKIIATEQLALAYIFYWGLFCWFWRGIPLKNVYIISSIGDIIPKKISPASILMLSVGNSIPTWNAKNSFREFKYSSWFHRNKTYRPNTSKQNRICHSCGKYVILTSKQVSNYGDSYGADFGWLGRTRLKSAHLGGFMQRIFSRDVVR